jgi:hypothetical protein
LRGGRLIEKQGGIPALRQPTGPWEKAMRIAPCLTSLTMIALLAAAPVCRALDPRPARAEILPIEDKDLAKLDKEENKRRRDERNIEQDGGDGTDGSIDGSQCGQVSIGNAASGSQNGVSRVVPNNTTVIVTGDVFNTASCGH